MSAAGHTPAATPDPEQLPETPAPFTMLGTTGVGVCEGDVCAMPGTATAPVAPDTTE